MKKILSLLLCLAMLLTLGLTAMGQAEDGGELRVSLCIAETLGDLGFYDSANEGLKRLEADYGVIGSVVECKSDASMYQVALVEAAEWNEELHRWMQSALTPYEQKVLRLFLAGYPYSEIASLLSSHSKAVDNALQRVRRKLRQFYSAHPVST